MANKNEVRTICDKKYYPDGEHIKVECTESICAVCGKKWISIYLNDDVVFGGSATNYSKGKLQEHCGCLL